MFVMILTDNLDRPVLDKTNLTGDYDFSLTYDQTGPKFTFTGPDVFTPIHDLGLKLEPQKSPVQMLLIDSVAHPTEN
jgi:uncharacterized protein (TIGR03435 family)